MFEQLCLRGHPCDAWVFKRRLTATPGSDSGRGGRYTPARRAFPLTTSSRRWRYGQWAATRATALGAILPLVLVLPTTSIALHCVRLTLQHVRSVWWRTFRRRSCPWTQGRAWAQKDLPLPRIRASWYDMRTLW